MVSNKRARTGADKLARRMQILDAALELWQEKGYDAVTMAQVADKLQIAKGTLYLYFVTKEDLFLAIYIQLLDEWFNKAGLALEDLGAPNPLSVSKALVGLLVERPNLARMIPLVAPVLERNVSEEVGREYKQWLMTRVQRLGEQIEDRLNGLAPGTGNDSLLYFLALAAGLGPMADSSPKLKAVINDPKFYAIKVEYEAALQHGFNLLLVGYQRLVR